MHFTRSIPLLCALSALPATATEITGKLHTAYSSGYLWRGLDLGDDLAEVGLTLNMNVDPLTVISGGAWLGSFDAPTGATTSVQTRELDLFADITHDFNWLKASVGTITYLYPNSSTDEASEIYVGIARDFSFATAALRYYWTVNGLGNDGYCEASLSRSMPINSCLTLNLSSTLGYLAEQGVASAWTQQVSVDWAFAATAKLSPFAACSLALSDQNDTAYAGSGNELIGGIVLSVTL